VQPPSFSEDGRVNPWSVALILMAVNILSFADRIVLAVLMPAIQAELNLSDTQTGLLTGLAFALFYATAGIPLARLADAWIRKKIIGFSVVVWSVMTALTGLATGYWQIFLARVGVGVGEAGVMPAASSLVADLFTSRKLPMALGLLFSGAAIGVIAGPAIGGVLAEAVGWRYALMALLVPGLVMSLLVFKFVPEPPRSRAAPGIPDGSSFMGLLRNPSFRLVVAAMSLVAFGIYGIINWLPIYYYRSFDLDLAQIGWLFGLSYGCAAALGSFGGGLLYSRFGAGRARVAFGLAGLASLASIPLWIATFRTSDLTVTLTLAALAALFVNFVNAPLATLVQQIVGARQRATAVAVVGLAANLIGAGLGPLLIGLLSDYLAPVYGDDALGMAMTVSSLVLIIPAALLFHATRQRITASLDISTAASQQILRE
jgi:predicted MFS family arabinose efflux permease